MLVPKGIAVINNLDFYRHGALLNVADFCKCLVRKVDHSAFDVRASVVNFHINRLVIVYIGHSHDSPEWQGFMSRSIRIHIIRLTTCCEPSMELIAIPRSFTSKSM